MTRATAHSAALLLVIGVFLASGSSVAGSGQTPRSQGFLKQCRLREGKLLDANRYARVYHNAQENYIGVCRPGDHEPEIALFPDAGVFPPPAIDLVGPYLGYAGQSTEYNADRVEVMDVRTMEPRFSTGLQGGVGSLRVNRRGSIAWIVCPSGGLSDGLDCGLNGPELPPRSVYRHDSRSTRDEPVQLLARSYRIAVRSLTRRKHRIRWRQARATRRASLR